jgi:hypothetical protein
VRGRAAALILMVIVLSGCAAEPTATGASPATSTEPTPTPTSTPTPTLTPTSTPSPVASADPSDPSTWVVTDAGMGPLVLGMPFAQATRAVPGLQDACTHAYYRSDNTLWIAWWQHDGVLEEATWYGGGASSPHTPEGLGIGSRVGDVLKAYPDAVHEVKNHDYLVAGHVFFGFPAETSGQIPRDALVDTIGTATGGPQYEYCG